MTADPSPPSRRFDLVIRNGTVYDGSGSAGVRADIGIAGDRIEAMGDIPAGLGPELDASGLAVAPGFIDVHSHDDWAVLAHPEFPAKVMQGVTTDIVGNCGTGAAPYLTAMERGIYEKSDRAMIGEWEGFAGYLARVDEVRPSLNIACLIGHGTLRAAAMGMADRLPTPGQLEQMKAWVREGVSAGAVGMSTGLIYEPGRYSDTGEIIELAKTLGPNHLYTSHMRNEGRYLLDSVAETIRIGEEAGVSVEISHHKVGGMENWGKVRESLSLIESARGRGVDVHADQYPYTVGSTGLFAVLQNNALNAKGVDGGLGRLSGDKILIASCPSKPEWEGRTIADFADEFDLPEEEAAHRVLSQEGRTFVVIETMDEDDGRLVLAHPTTMIGSDGVPVGSKPHPRHYGTFPRVLGHYCRDLGLIDLPTAIHKMTGMPAAKFHLTGRGIVRAGAFADIVVFDPATIADRGTYNEPVQFPVGIKAVIVNGVLVAKDGEHTHARPGRAVRRD